MVWAPEQALAWGPAQEQEPGQVQERELAPEREQAHEMGECGTRLHGPAEVEVEWPAHPSRGAKASPSLSCPMEAGRHCMNA